MQTYIIGIGQCGTSVAFDVISQLTGFVKSKDVTSSPQSGGSDTARNQLQALLDRDMRRRETLVARIESWASRLWNGPNQDRRAFVPPKIAIIDGNPDNFVKDAFQNFRGTLAAQPEEDDEANDGNLRHVANLIMETKVLDLGQWRSGCANGIVGEQVACTYLQPEQLRAQLGVDGQGNLADANMPFPVAIFLVVSAGGGATGSGGGVYLGKTDALVTREERPRHATTLNVVVLPSTTSSLDNRRYALNAGRALARHGNVIGVQNDDIDSNRPSSTMLFSNPRDEGDSKSLQRLNNYIAEFAIRLGNFTFPGNVARIARDVDVRELVRFLYGKVSVLAMSHLPRDGWKEPEIESMLVKRAFANMYETDADVEKPYGVSVEDPVAALESTDTAGVLSTASSAIFMIGVPPNFERALSLEQINKHVRTRSTSLLRSGIRAFSYGSSKDLELTVLLRYRTMSACSLASYFVGQYISGHWSSPASEIPETEYLRARVEQDDDDAEAFEEIVDDLNELESNMSFNGYTVRRQSDRTWFSSSAPGDATTIA